MTFADICPSGPGLPHTTTFRRRKLLASRGFQSTPNPALSPPLSQIDRRDLQRKRLGTKVPAIPVTGNAVILDGPSERSTHTLLPIGDQSERWFC